MVSGNVKPFSLLLRCVLSYVNLLFYSLIDATEVDPLE